MVKFWFHLFLQHAFNSFEDVFFSVTSAERAKPHRLAVTCLRLKDIILLPPLITAMLLYACLCVLGVLWVSRLSLIIGFSASYFQFTPTYPGCREGKRKGTSKSTASMVEWRSYPTSYCVVQKISTVVYGSNAHFKRNFKFLSGGRGIFVLWRERLVQLLFGNVLTLSQTWKLGLGFEYEFLKFNDFYYVKS